MEGIQNLMSPKSSYPNRTTSKENNHEQTNKHTDTHMQKHRLRSHTMPYKPDRRFPPKLQTNTTNKQTIKQALAKLLTIRKKQLTQMRAPSLRPTNGSNMKQHNLHFKDIIGNITATTSHRARIAGGHTMTMCKLFIASPNLITKSEHK